MQQDNLPAIQNISWVFRAGGGRQLNAERLFGLELDVGRREELWINQLELLKYNNLIFFIN